MIWFDQIASWWDLHGEESAINKFDKSDNKRSIDDRKTLSEQQQRKSEPLWTRRIALRICCCRFHSHFEFWLCEHRDQFHRGEDEYDKIRVWKTLSDHQFASERNGRAFKDLVSRWRRIQTLCFPRNRLCRQLWSHKNTQRFEAAELALRRASESLLDSCAFWHYFTILYSILLFLQIF